MRFVLSIFVTLAVVAGIAVAQDASPSAAKDAFDKAAVRMPLSSVGYELTPFVDPKGLAPQGIQADGSPWCFVPGSAPIECVQIESAPVESSQVKPAESISSAQISSAQIRLEGSSISGSFGPWR